MKWRKTGILILYMLTGILYAQDPYYIRIDKSKGLPSNAVYDMYQDSHGFMWFATDEGLCRYDGKNFKTYTSAVVTSRSGTCIHEDPSGRIWYTNFDNKIYYIENEEVKGINQNPATGTFIKYHLVHHWLFVPQIAGLDVFDVRDQKIKKTISFQGVIQVSGSSDYCFLQDSYNDVYRIDSSLNVLRVCRGRDQLNVGASYQSSVCLFSRNNITRKYMMCNGQLQITEYPFAYAEYMNNISFTDNQVWICTKNGVYKKSLAGKEDYQHYFAGKQVSYVLKDKDDNYWVSTTHDGILFIPSLSNRFFMFNDFVPQLLQVDHNRVWMGGKTNTILEFNLEDYQSKNIFSETSSHEVTCFLNDPVMNYLFVSSDLFYIVKNGTTIARLPLAAKEIQKIDNQYYSMASSGICGLISTGAATGNSTWDGLHSSYGGKKLDYFSRILREVRGKSTAYDPRLQVIYYATNAGLFAASPYTVREIKNRTTTIQARKVLVYKSSVLALQSNGIILEIKPNGKIQEYPLMLHEDIIAVNKMILRENKLFLITNGEGVYIMDLDHPTFFPQHIEEINKNEDIGDIEIWQDKYLISCSNGLLMIDVNGPQKKKQSPRLVINEMKINGQALNKGDRMAFTYYQNNLHISYSILAFNTNLGYPLYYRINHGEWKLTPAESRELELASLRPDEYKIDFRLGTGREFPLQTIQFTINKPIWQVHWFWIGIICILTIIAYGIYKWRVQALSKKNKLLLEKVELEKNLNKSVLTSIKAQMNPHFFYNALNTIQSFIFADDKKNASTYLSKFSKLTRLILEMSEKEMITLAEEVQALQLYLDIEKIRFNDKLNFDIIVADNIEPEILKIPPMIIQPYVENAIKHGLLHKKEEGRLLIDFATRNHALVVTIDDNGIGRKKSAELNTIKENKHQPFATAANQKRLEILNKHQKNLAVEFIDKVDQAGNSTGTTVIISLPLNI